MQQEGDCEVNKAGGNSIYEVFMDEMGIFSKRGICDHRAEGGLEDPKSVACRRGHVLWNVATAGGWLARGICNT